MCREFDECVDTVSETAYAIINDTMSEITFNDEAGFQPEQEKKK